MEIIYLTGNSNKFNAAKKALKDTNIQLIQKVLDIEEIQSESVEEVSIYKAKVASSKLKLPLIVTDGGVYIKSLNGFPGPFIKYINKWLTGEDLIKLMEDKEDRSIEMIETLVYCEPGVDPIVFTSTRKGKVAYEPGSDYQGAINQVFIPEGYDKTISDLDEKTRSSFWGLNWEKFTDYFNSQV